jgi:hypothetical protein
MPTVCYFDETTEARPGHRCQLAAVSRAGFHRYLERVGPNQADVLLRARLQELAVEHHRHRGYRMRSVSLRIVLTQAEYRSA